MTATTPPETPPTVDCDDYGCEFCGERECGGDKCAPGFWDNA